MRENVMINKLYKIYFQATKIKRIQKNGVYPTSQNYDMRLMEPIIIMYVHIYIYIWFDKHYCVYTQVHI